MGYRPRHHTITPRQLHLTNAVDDVSEVSVLTRDLARELEPASEDHRKLLCEIDIAARSAVAELRAALLTGSRWRAALDVEVARWRMEAWGRRLDRAVGRRAVAEATLEEKLDAVAAAVRGDEALRDAVYDRIKTRP